jgi:hypothetical protein
MEETKMPPTPTQQIVVEGHRSWRNRPSGSHRLTEENLSPVWDAATGSGATNTPCRGDSIRLDESSYRNSARKKQIGLVTEKSVVTL